MATLDDITLGDIELDPLAGLTLDDIEIQPAEGSGFWRQAADLPVSAAGGVITGLKGMTDLFGANNPVSQELASYQEFYRQSLSPEAQADQREVARIMQEAQDKGVWEQIKAGGRAFAVAPLDTAAQSLGTMAPIVATGVAGRALGLGAKGVQAVQAGAGAGMNTGIVKDSIYQDTKNFLLQSGKSEEEADRVALEAQSYGGQNIDQLLLAAGLGAADALFGAEKILGNAISKSGGRVTGGVVAGALKTGVSEGIPEAAQGGQEAMAPNIALQREGYAVPTMRGVASSATMEGLSGFMAGAPVGAAEGMAAQPMDDRNAPTMSVGPDASTFTPPPAADTVEVQETFGDATTAAAPVEEAAPAAEPSINPDDFEVVEMPGETIVTEPPAAEAEPASAFVAPESTQADTIAPAIQRFVEAPTDTPLGDTYKVSAAAPLYRTVSLRDWERAQEQGFLDSDQRGAVSQKEGMNLSPSIEASKTYAPKDDYGVVLKIEPDAAKWHGYNYDQYIRTWDRIPIEKISEVERTPLPPIDTQSPQQPAAKPAAKIKPKTVTAYRSNAAPNVVFDTETRAAWFTDDIDDAKDYASLTGASEESVEKYKINTENFASLDDPTIAKEISDIVPTVNDLSAVTDAMPQIRQRLSGRYRGVKVTAFGMGYETTHYNPFFKEAILPARQPASSPAQRSRRRIKNMTAQSGAIDLSIVEDLFEYGKTIYRAGMSFGKWAGQMVKEFGQGIASFLKQAFDRIVQAYKDSPYSSESGAVSVGGDAVGRRQQQGLSTQEALELDKGPKIRLYRAMQIIGGKLYPPMSALVKGELRNPTEIGVWERAEERPDLLDKNGKFVLNKGNRSTVPAAYNPYFHTSSSPLNDQFSSAYKRDNLVTVEVEVPASELTSGYRAEGAKDTVGEVRWNSGPVSSRLPADRRRRVVLSRYAKVVRVVPDGEVAGTIAKLLEGTGIPIPENTVTPSLAAELEKSGVRVIRKADIASALANAQSGGIDASVLADIVEFGKAIYQNGMTFGKWSAEMVAEFGQAVAKYLKESFDRIVQAYKDSPYSDTTGAVGNVRPKAKPRQFEQKAKANAAITEEAKAELGSEYIPITLEGTAEQAKALINESGLDAAEQRILDLSSDELTPAPIDFGIGLELTARLGAMGEHQRQARVVRIMSRRATSMGQTISVLAMLARLTPEGIVFYANQVIEQYIDTLPEERQGQIRAAQDSVVSAETEVKATRKTVAEDTIINGTQGGEKIQEKLKRRIKDKTQKQRTNVGIRSVLTSKATKAEATKQITQLLTENGISESEAGALATAITSKFYKVLDEARRSIATQRKPKEPKLIRSWSKLIEKLNGDGMPDDDFIAQLSLIAKLPTMTPELGARLRGLTTQLKEAKGDQDMQLVIAGRIFEEIHSLVPVDFWVKVRAFSYIMMLFSPKTWIRNIGGNVIQFVANAGKDTAINVATGRAGIFSNGKTGDRVKSGRLKHLLTPYYDVKKGFEWNAKQNPQAPFSENLAAGIDHLRLLSKLTTQNKFEVADAKEVGRRIFSSKFMGMLETSLSIALGGPDRAFWKSALESSLANREARAKQMGEWTGRHTPEDIEGAIADAAGAIYQNANTISKEAAKWRSSLNRMSTKLLSYFIPGVKPTEQFGFGTALMAFTQVPGAIARAAISWSPLGLIINLHQGMNGILWKASNQRAGKPLDTREFGEAFTKALGGTGIYAAGYYLYAMGVITASQEDDDDVEAMRRSLGMGQYRINVTALKRLLTTMAWGTPQKTDEGDVILSYDWAQPLAITLAAGAELAKMVEQNDRNGIKKGLAAKAAMPAISLAAGAKSLLDLPLLSGLSSFIDQLDTRRPESVIGALARTVAGIPSMFVPQLVRQANQLLYDNTLRETRGTNQSSAVPVTVQRAFNQIAANTPGVADQFPPRLDVMGQAQERYQYVGWHWFNVLFNPALTSRVKANPVLEEAARLMDSTGETSQFPKQVKNRASINGQNIDLTNEQISAYQYYLGNYTASMMNWRMASPRYARLPDTEKVRIFAQDIEDVDAAVKSALFGHDIRRLTRRQRSMRNNLVNSPLGQSMPPR